MIDKIQNKDPLQLTDIASLQTLVVECMNVIESQSNVIAKQGIPCYGSKAKDTPEKKTP